MTDHIPPDCLLTLIVPSALAEDLLDLLRGQPRLAPGFTLAASEAVCNWVDMAPIARCLFP